MKTAIWTLLGTFLLVLPLYSAEPTPTGTDDISMGANACNEFGLDLYSRLGGGNDNIVFSPFSVISALAMTSVGAAGNTADQMRSVLHIGANQHRVDSGLKLIRERLCDANNSGTCDVTIANSLWAQKGHHFLSQYLGVAGDCYGSSLMQVDFASDPEEVRKEINKWVESATKEKIKELIAPGVLTSLTRLVLCNAVYFKAKWVTTFPENNTKDEPFKHAGEETHVPMMHVRDSFMYARDESAQILQLPYLGTSLAMYVILPTEDNGLAEFEKGLNTSRLDNLVKSMDVRPVDVYIPRFKIEKGVGLANKLKALGMTEAFGQEADFSGIDGTTDLFISAVMHKAFIEVEEKGTEAAASTAVVMSLKSAMPSPEKPVVFKADHPFMFMLRDNESGAIFFMGRMARP